jgi:hypothetical protein
LNDQQGIGRAFDDQKLTTKKRWEKLDLQEILKEITKFPYNFKGKNDIFFLNHSIKNSLIFSLIFLRGLKMDMMSNFLLKSIRV